MNSMKNADARKPSSHQRRRIAKMAAVAPAMIKTVPVPAMIEA